MKTSTKRALSNAALSCIVLGALIFTYLAQPLFLRWADLRIYDVLMHYNREPNPSPALAIIDIDEKSLDAYGQWPWPRYRMAQLITILAENQAVAIGLDILQAEADQTSPATLQKNFKDIFNVDITIENIPPFLQDNDALLAGIYKQAPIVSGIFLPIGENIQQDASKVLRRADVNFMVQKLPNAIEYKDKLITAQDITLPVDVLEKSGPLGFINVAPDIDGILRAIPLVMQHNNVIYPSLALRTLMRAIKTKNILLRVGEDGLEQIKVGAYTIPVTPEGLFHILFRGPKKIYPYFSVVDVMEGRVAANELKGRILFVGTSATGLLDLRATPFDPIYPGVESHVTAVDNILNNRHIIIPPWTPGVQITLIILVGIICAFVFSLAKPAFYLITALSLACASIGSSQLAFADKLFFSPLYSLFTIIAIGSSLLMLRFWQTEKQKFVLQKAFSNYVSPEIVSQIAEKGGNILEGQSKEVSIMFTDVRGFTTLSERLQPTQVVSLLNAYLTPMTALILKSSGTVDKFIGDAIMAFWNAPLDVPNHPIHAIQTAIDMMDAVEVLNIELQKKYDVQLAIGAGIHTGIAHVGNMGSAELLDYTCIGDSVNLCARLESLCSKYGRTIITSEYTKNLCTQDGENAFNFMEIDNITVKGKSEPIKIFTILSTHEKEHKMEEFSIFQQAIAFYQLGNFTEADELLLELQESDAKNKTYSLYHQRCADLIKNPPEEWNGVWKFDSK